MRSESGARAMARRRIRPAAALAAAVGLLALAPGSALGFGFIGKWGGEGVGAGRFDFPVALDTGPDGSVVVADALNRRIQKFDNDGDFVTSWGEGASGAEGEIDFPQGLATDAAGNVFVSEYHRHRIQKFDSGGEFVEMWGWGVDDGSAEFQVCSAGCQDGIGGSGEGQFIAPGSLATDAAGNLYVVDTLNNRVQKLSPSGGFLGEWGAPGTDPGEFNVMGGIATGPDGSVYVSEQRRFSAGPTGANRIQRFTADGDFVSAWKRKVGSAPFGMETGPDGSLYVAEAGSRRVQVFDRAGTYLRTLGSKGSGSGRLDAPFDLARDADGNLFVAEAAPNQRIQKWGPGGRPILGAEADELQRLRRMRVVARCELDDCRVQVSGRIDLGGRRPESAGLGTVALRSERVGLRSGKRAGIRLLVEDGRKGRRRIARRLRRLPAGERRAEVVVRLRARSGEGTIARAKVEFELRP